MSTMDGSGTIDMQEVHNSVGMMERELKMLDREIYLLERHLETCEMQQKHLRDQILGLAGQGVRLIAKETQISMSFYETKGGDRSLNNEMAEVKGLIDANHNTRTTLLEQRTQTDKEKQAVEDQLKEKRRLKSEQEARLKRIKDLKSALDASSSPDPIMETAIEVSRDLEGQAGDRRAPGDFPGAMESLEAEEGQLGAVEARLRVLAEARAEPERAERAAQVVGILQGLVDVNRQRNGLLADRWAASDLDLSSFFRHAARPPHFCAEDEGAGRPQAGLWALPF